MKKSWLKNSVVEFVGTFALIFVGAGSIIATGGQNLVAIALAHGLAIGLMVAAAGHISGGVYNPALTVGLMAARRIPVGRGVYYIVAQLVGATVAALALKVLFAPAAIAAVNLGTPAVGLGVSGGAAVLAEIIMTFFLMYSVFGVAVDLRGARAIAGLVIGLTITMDIFVGGGLTGAAMNPARWFGPAVVQGAFDNWWIYWVAPIVGAVIAALLWNELYLRGVAVPQPGAAHVDIEHTETVDTQATEAAEPGPRRIAA
jgi:aquaporin TIP